MPESSVAAAQGNGRVIGRYTAKSILLAIVYAVVLHAVVLGSYFLLGPTKNIEAAAPGAAKTGAPKADAGAKAGPKDDASAPKTAEKTDGESKTGPEAKKTGDVEKPPADLGKKEPNIDELLK